MDTMEETEVKKQLNTVTEGENVKTDIQTAILTEKWQNSGWRQAGHRQRGSTETHRERHIP